MRTRGPCAAAPGPLQARIKAHAPRAREAFLILKEKGHAVYLWSSGGPGYAATAVELLGVADLVSGCFDKRQEPGVPVDFAVDDDASVVEAHGGYRVTPFDGDPADEELLRVAEAVDGASGRRATP